MGWPLQEKFDPGAPISSIPRVWFETVAKILNYLMCANGNMVKTPNPSKDAPWIIVPGTAGGASGSGDTLPDITDHAGQVLTVNADASAAEWAAPAAELPPPGNIGQMLQVDETNKWSAGPRYPLASALSGSSPGKMMYYAGSQWNTTSAPATGDMMYFNGAQWVFVPKPTTGYAHLLTYNKTTTFPSWALESSITGSDPLPTTGKSAYKVLSIASDGSTVQWDYVRAT